jgi:hypothetical protein
LQPFDFGTTFSGLDSQLPFAPSLHRRGLVEDLDGDVLLATASRSRGGQRQHLGNFAGDAAAAKPMRRNSGRLCSKPANAEVARAVEGGRGAQQSCAVIELCIPRRSTVRPGIRPTATGTIELDPW